MKDKTEKIAILTFHGSQNYGGVLQAYALQHFIKTHFQVEVHIIDFVVREVAIFQTVSNWKHIILNLLILLRYPAYRRKRNRFNRFRHSFMHLTQRCSTLAEIKGISAPYDIIISGSDQVFHPLNPRKEIYYLAYLQEADRKKIAYAPSFGLSDIPAGITDKTASLLNGFDFLSARENTGATIIRKLTGRKAEVLLDPVLLLEPSSWRRISRRPSKADENFILCYALVGRLPQMKLANQIKELTGLPVVLLTHGFLPRTNADRTIQDAGPREFLWLLDHAGYVVTDSFHGTAFSVLFEKPFFTYIASPEKADRIFTLLQSLSITHRVKKKPGEIKPEELTLDFTQPRKKLQKQRFTSIRYLQKALCSDR